MKRQKSPNKWNESDLDAAYERKPHHSYDSRFNLLLLFSSILHSMFSVSATFLSPTLRCPAAETEWLRSPVPSGNWRESNLDGPPLAPNPKKVGVAICLEVK